MKGTRFTALAAVVVCVACADLSQPVQPLAVDDAQLRAPRHALAMLTSTPQVSAGNSQTCALKADQTVVCWGFAYSSGQESVPAGLTSVAQISVGGGHTCALKTDGMVVCWGYNVQGQTTVPAGLASVTQVSAGFYHTCALKTDGAVVCWGLNDYGQSTPPDPLATVAQLSAGGFHTCALQTDGNVACWGNSTVGQTTVPIGLASVAQVSVGYHHSCALKTDGTVVCWGWNPYGQASVPGGLISVAQLGTGVYHTCALRINGTVICWGYNYNGQLLVPSGLASAVQLTAGGYHNCALKTNGTVVCWGQNFYGQTNVPAGLNLNPTLAPPNADAGPSRTGFEGTPFVFDGRGSSDPYGGVLTYSWNFGDGSALATGATPSHTYLDNGTYTATLTVSNGSSTSSGTTTATILNAPPLVGPISGPIAPVQVNGTVTASASLTDPGTLDKHTAGFNWGDGTSSAGAVSEVSGSGSVSGSHTYSAAGVYTVTLTVTDNDGGTAQSVLEFVVVFDPAAGFVTGSGSINSPPGAYAPDVSLSGRANFGFVSNYQKGATVPSGNTRFQFHTADLHFRSASYEWLVIAGPQAKFKGSGTINGVGDFGFMLSAVDGDVNGGGGTDKFRIKIWDKATGGVVYDNETGATDDATATTVIGAGSISIHK